MSAIFIATGKKKYVDQLEQHFQDLAKKGEIQILASRRNRKTTLLMPYYELKILFESESGKSIELETSLVRNLGYAGIGQSDQIVMKMRTTRTEEPMSRFNILNIAGNFQKRGGQIKIVEHVDDSRVRKYYFCDLALAGPIRLVFGFRDMLKNNEMVEEDSFEYIL
ncbi:hypothetical protein [Acanthopleuribacter pedis]|uniref:Uncharacterized protein n=1 Tax=Acanthopleuribacter pedis TaxID=442870 RepID=A0A8J7QBZ6_9BACT|nr:hypothetical protein [Acanthopleuribacter pedis]MBO1318191.1 hypothetical protein [Acanthopleuribacter pedis]